MRQLKTVQFPDAYQIYLWIYGYMYILHVYYVVYKIMKNIHNTINPKIMYFF